MSEKHLSDIVTEETYAAWIKGKKIILQAPTGLGKTYFMLHVFIPYCKRFGKKVLILCNRKMLKEQYDFDLAYISPRYVEVEENVALMTYQQIAEAIKQDVDIEVMLKKFDVVIFDECHFFYADSDFNALGTYVTFQVLIKSLFFKSLIFMTATVEEVKPMIIRALTQCRKKIHIEAPEVNLEPFAYTDDFYNFSRFADYSRFSCHFFPDAESLAAELAKSEKKSLVFIDDSAKANALRNHLLKTLNVPPEDVRILSSQIMEDNPNDAMLRELLVGNRLPVKILITTSVLDNGFSIHDSEVGNVVIATESRVSFLQMLGRIRGEQVEECRLFIYPRDRAYFEKRIQQYEAKMREFSKLKEISLNGNHFKVVSAGWFGNDEKAEFLRNFVVYTRNEYEYYCDKFEVVRRKYPNPILAINDFAKEKTGNMLYAEKKFLRLSCQEDKAAVAREQIKWIGKNPDELTVWDSSYRQEREQQLKDMLLKVNGLTNVELQKVKEEIATEFRKDILSDMNLKTGSFSRQKLVKLCERCNLYLNQGTDSENRAVYSISEK